MNNKGFTLVELLAVIVILAVVMLIGVTAVLPLINKAQKNSLASEGLGLIEVGKTAFNAQQLGESELHLLPNSSYCFSIDWLKKHNLYEKASDKYFGSVLIYFNKTGKYDYFFWISNGNFHISGGSADSYNVEDGAGDDGINTCGGIDLSGNNSTNPNIPTPTPHTPYTGIAYRNNGKFTPLESSIVAPTDNVTVWARTTGGLEIDVFYYNEDECRNELNALGWSSYRCLQRTGLYGGLGKYLTSLEDYMAVTNTFYCEVGKNCRWDNGNILHDDHYYSMNECEFVTNATCEEVVFNQEAFFLKHYIENDIIKSSEACIYYDGNEFCISQGYWDTDSYTTLNKLRNGIRNALGVYPDKCENESDKVYCKVGDVYIDVWEDGIITSYGYAHAGCSIYPSGGSTCHGDYIKE